ncbi:MAG: hypothetical protein QOG53_795 [Frankiales bacterium]|jgi:hypothetical protein|nr:hypothetical protein [Frankiales bacterium]
MTPAHAPPGWPAEVRPPDAPDWERTAVAWLFDLCPPDYRAYDVLRRYPVVLARFAAGHVAAAQEAARAGLGTARAELRDAVPPEAVESAVAAYERESHRLVGTARAVALVEEALRGRRFVPRL